MHEHTSSLPPQPWLRASKRSLRLAFPCQRTLDTCVFRTKATNACTVAATTSGSGAASRLVRCCPRHRWCQ